MLNVKDLEFSYNDNKFLYNINFEIEKGKFVAILGKNGAGKSTIFKCILSIYKSYKGNIIVDNINTRDISAHSLSKKIAYIPQKNATTFNYNVKTFILMGTSNRFNVFSSPKQEQYDLVDEIIDLLGINDIAYKSYNRISGGEQQLVLIARALAQKTDYIIMDEPTSALDFCNQEIIMKKIQNLVMLKGIGVLLSMHNPNLVLKYCDEVVALSKGTIIASGKTSVILDEKLISDIFGIKAKIYNTDSGKFIQSTLC